MRRAHLDLTLDLVDREDLQLAAQARHQVLLLLAKLVGRADLVVDVPLLLHRSTARHERVRPKASHTALSRPLKPSRHSVPRLSTTRSGPAARGATRSWPR